MATVEAQTGGTAAGYFSRRQLTALMQEAEDTGLPMGQIVKLAVVRELVDRGRLEEKEIERIEGKQDEISSWPSALKKPVSQLRRARVVEEAQETSRSRRRRRRG